MVETQLSALATILGFWRNIPESCRGCPLAEGDHVKKGEVLLQLKNTEMENQVKEAEAELAVEKEVYKTAEADVALAEAEFKGTSKQIRADFGTLQKEGGG